MILACDQYDQIIRLAWGEDPESTEVEEYEEQEEALRRIQELAAAAEKIVISQESSFAKKQQDEGKTVSRVHRLEAVYWGLRERTNGDRCLILSIGQESCAGGVIQGGCLINQRVESRNLTLRSIATQIGEKNSQLMQVLKGQYEGNTSDAQEALLRELSKSLRGKGNPSFFFHSPSFPQLAKLLSIPLKEQIQEFLVQLDPQKKIKTLICTDWAATGSLAELLQENYYVVCSTNDPLTDAVRGMILFGWTEAKCVSEARTTAALSKVEEKLDAVRRVFPLIDIIRELRPSLLPFRSLSEYVKLSDDRDTLLLEMDRLRKREGVDLGVQAEKLLREIEAFGEKATDLARNQQPIWFVPFLDKAAQVPALGGKLNSLKDMLGIEDIPVEVGVKVEDLSGFDVVQTKGAGPWVFIDEVVEHGYQEKATGTPIKRPKVVIRLGDDQREEKESTLQPPELPRQEEQRRQQELQRQEELRRQEEQRRQEELQRQKEQRRQRRRRIVREFVLPAALMVLVLALVGAVITAVVVRQPTSTLPQTLTGHSKSVRSVAFSPDGKTVASGSEDFKVILWDAQTGEAKQTLIKHEGSVEAVAFSPDGKTVASGSEDFKVILWDVQTGEVKRTIWDRDRVHSVAFAPNGETLATGSADNTVRLWDARTGGLKQILTKHEGSVEAVAFSPDGKTVASGSEDFKVILWDVQTGEVKRTLRGHRDQVHTVAFSPDGKTVAGGGRDNTVRLWDAQTGELKQTLARHEGSVEAVAFSPDGKTVASGSKDFKVILWDVQTGEPTQTFSGHDGLVESVVFSPDGETVASGGADSKVMLWDVSTNSTLRRVLNFALYQQLYGLFHRTWPFSR